MKEFCKVLKCIICILSLKKCHICKKGFSTDDNKKKYHKVKGHCRYT